MQCQPATVPLLAQPIGQQGAQIAGLARGEPERLAQLGGVVRGRAADESGSAGTTCESFMEASDHGVGMAAGGG